MALKYISELTLTNNIDDNDLLVVDDGSKNYAIKWSTLKAALATVSGFTVNNTNGTITITLATGASLTVTPHDPTKQDLLTFDSTPTENSNNPVKSGGVFAAIGLKLDAADYAQYTGATDQQAGTAGYVPAPVAGGERYLSSSGVWQAPDSTPTENSNKPVSSDAVYAALLDLAEQLSDEYDATATYDVGDYCIHENKLYKCTTAIATAEAWNSAHWTATTVGAELGAKVNTSDIVNNLTSTATDKPLSAAKGKALNDKIAQFEYHAITASQSNPGTFTLDAGSVYLVMTRENQQGFRCVVFLITKDQAMVEIDVMKESQIDITTNGLTVTLGNNSSGSIVYIIQKLNS